MDQTGFICLFPRFSGMAESSFHERIATVKSDTNITLTLDLDILFFFAISLSPVLFL